MKSRFGPCQDRDHFEHPVVSDIVYRARWHVLRDRFPADRVLRGTELLVGPLRFNYQWQDLTQLHFCLVVDSDFALILVHLKTRFLFVAGRPIRVLNCHGLSHCFDASGPADTLEQIEALLE